MRHRSTKEDWKALLKKPADLVVAAGGDGTVRRVALAAAEHGLPFAVDPDRHGQQHREDDRPAGRCGRTDRELVGVAARAASLRPRRGRCALGRGPLRRRRRRRADRRPDRPRGRSRRRCEAARPRDGPRAAPPVRARERGADAPLADQGGRKGPVRRVLRGRGAEHPLRRPEPAARAPRLPGRRAARRRPAREGRPPAAARLPREAHAPRERATAGAALRARARDRDRRAGGRALAPRRQDLAQGKARRREGQGESELPCPAPRPSSPRRAPSASSRTQPPGSEARGRTLAAMQATRSAAWAWPGSRSGS